MLETVLKNAIKGAVETTLAEEAQEIVAKEMRRALREREEEFTALVRSAIGAAMSELFSEKA